MAVQQVERLRPAAMQSRPVRVDPVFDDPDAVIGLIRSRAPYPSLGEYHHMLDMLGGVRARPVFRTHFDDALFVHNPRWIEAARQAFSATIVRPFKCLLNLNGPMGIGGTHVDLPVFRGFSAPRAPVWLLMNMAYSGLFQDWMVPVASGLMWFWKGVGGEFQYWADGIDAPPRIESPPLWNTGVMSDNEYMWHGVAPTGTPEEQARLRGRLDGREKLHYAGDAQWEIRAEARTVARLPESQLRISLLWKAFVFWNEDHVASFEDRSMDLSIEQVIEIYEDDLARKGIATPRPREPFEDPAWRKTLDEVYRSPFADEQGDYA
jgi:hypothetical protein